MICDSAATLPVPVLEQLYQGKAAQGWNLQDKPKSKVNSPATPNAWEVAVSKNLAAISALRPGWDGGHSKRIASKTIFMADRLLKDALVNQPRAVAPYIIPSSDGSLVFAWRTAALEIEFNLAEDGDKSFWLRDRRSGAEHESEGDAATESLFRWARQVAEPVHDEAHVPVEEEKAGLLLVA